MARGSGPTRLDRAAAAPLWAQLEADLERRLQRGAFDDSFPGEHELAEQYDVSRHTVREALRRMRGSGLLDSTRGRGTSVSRVGISQPLGALYSLFGAVESTGVEQRSRVRVCEVRRDAAAAARLGCAEGTDFVHLERLRLADGEPLALDRVWLLHSLAAPLLDVDLTHVSLYGELARLTGLRLTGGRERISAQVAEPSLRRLLGIDADTAVLAVARIGCLHGRPVEFRESLIRGDRFSLTAQWPGGAGYRGDPTF